ncbi:hypothetical protein L3Y34_011897 [Caenorhabditis briggsae]|uniref:Uncharacterized protein n=1 Tax=Caenorhabditis briggsae TaxID=6238 RepID=A0AAE8ZR68_CAEBR|nr:hypothetical protein L3Y34_011897 [Caenorhabditis briggsae]
MTSLFKSTWCEKKFKVDYNSDIVNLRIHPAIIKPPDTQQPNRNAPTVSLNRQGKTTVDSSEVNMYNCYAQLKIDLSSSSSPDSSSIPKSSHPMSARDIPGLMLEKNSEHVMSNSSTGTQSEPAHTDAHDVFHEIPSQFRSYDVSGSDVDFDDGEDDPMAD